MTTLKEAAQKALEALETLKSCKSITIWCSSADDAIEALKAALAQPVEPVEPVAWIFPNDIQKLKESETFVHAYSVKCGSPDGITVPVYDAAPAPQPAQPCTRSHPHELMDGYCELRTEIARLTNENARLKAQPVAVQEPVKLYAGPPEAHATEKRFFDTHGTEYTLMNGCIANCIFVGFEKLVDIGLAMKITEEPEKVEGIIYARMEIVEIGPVAQPLKASEIVTMYAEQPTCDADMIEFAREIEAAHGIKKASE